MGRLLPPHARGKVACYFQKNKSISEVEPKTEAFGVLVNGLPRRVNRSSAFPPPQIYWSLRGKRKETKDSFWSGGLAFVCVQT